MSEGAVCAFWLMMLNLRLRCADDFCPVLPRRAPAEGPPRRGRPPKAKDAPASSSSKELEKVNADVSYYRQHSFDLLAEEGEGHAESSGLPAVSGLGDLGSE